MFRNRLPVYLLALLSLGLMSSGCGEGSSGSDSGSKCEEAPAGTVERISQYILADSCGKLIIEVDSVATSAPTANAETYIESILEEVLDKPDGVEVRRDEMGLESRGADHAWTPQEINQLLAQTYNLEVEEGAIKMHALFLDGHYAGSTGARRILGLDWEDFVHVVVFKGEIESICSTGLYASIPDAENTLLCEHAESAVWLHQLGHLLGLVNKGVPNVGDHEDPEHPGHSTGEDSVMRWDFEWSELDGGAIDQFFDRMTINQKDPLGLGADCSADLASFREAP